MKNNPLRLWTILSALALAMVLGFASAVPAYDVKTMTKEELKKVMDQDTVTILDVRSGRDWSSSEIKIKGAHRLDSKSLSTQAAKYPKDNTLVLYCA